MPRNLLCAAVAAILLVPASALAQQQSPNQGQQQGQTAPAASSQTAAQSSSAAAGADQSAAPVDPLVAAARKARDQKKDQAKPAHVFDNDNVPKSGGISAVGQTPTEEAGDNGGAAEAGGAEGKAAASSPNDEKSWRDRFAKLRHKLDEDQAELDIMQRELGVLDVQYYNDPVKALQQGYTRSDIDEKTAKIDAKKKQIEADGQAISDAEEELRKSGGDAGWAR
jgi:hypothetical protein